MTKRNIALNHARHIRTGFSRRCQAYSEMSETIPTSKQRKYFLRLIMQCKDKNITDIPDRFRNPAGRIGFMEAIDYLEGRLGIESKTKDNFATKIVYDSEGMHQKIIFVGENDRDPCACDDCTHGIKNLNFRKELWPCYRCFNKSMFVRKENTNEYTVD